MAHCWMGAQIRQDDGVEYSVTCMLDEGHEGTHEWTPDSEIRITFAPSETQS